MRSAMDYRPAIVLLFTVACGGTDPDTTAGASSSSSDAATTGTGTTAPTTGTGSTTAPATTDLPTGGSGGGTDSAGGSESAGSSDTDATGTTTDASGSGSGGQGSGKACTKWYQALVASYSHFCECQVSLGLYPDVAACVAMQLPPEDCMCDVFAMAPETADILACYEKAAVDKTLCLDKLGLCAEGLPLQLCDELEVTALLTCGLPPPQVCEALTTMCDQLPLMLCL